MLLRAWARLGWRLHPPAFAVRALRLRPSPWACSGHSDGESQMSLLDREHAAAAWSAFAVRRFRHAYFEKEAGNTGRDSGRASFWVLLYIEALQACAVRAVLV